MLNSPLISIVIPCYNQGAFLNKTLESVYNQTYVNWECIIVNDGSTDETAIVANFWCELDKRFKYTIKENGGLSSARNAGLDRINGDFVQFLDSDDILDIDKLSECINVLREIESDIVITNFLRFRKDLQKTKKAFCKLEDQNFNYQSLLLDWDLKYTIPIHCGLFKESAIGLIRFDESLNAKEDWVFWLDVFKNTPSVSFINKVLVYYRVHKKSMTRNIELMEENQEKALMVIYNKLDEKYKKVFFKRIVSELSCQKIKFILFKRNIWYKKIFYSIKKNINI